MTWGHWRANRDAKRGILADNHHTARQIVSPLLVQVGQGIILCPLPCVVSALRRGADRPPPGGGEGHVAQTPCTLCGGEARRHQEATSVRTSRRVTSLDLAGRRRAGPLLRHVRLRMGDTDAAVVAVHGARMERPLAAGHEVPCPERLTETN
jgi:hypothetical protein